MGDEEQVEKTEVVEEVVREETPAHDPNADREAHRTEEGTVVEETTTTTTTETVEDEDD